MWKAALPLGALLAVGCSGPEGEDPVALKPGLYAVDTGGGEVLFLKNGETRMELCLAAADAAALLADPLGTLAYPWDRCREAPAPVRGNAMSGERVCGPDDGGQPWAHIQFKGSHGQDRFKLEGHSSHPGDRAGMTDFRSGDFAISGERVGDC